MPDVGPLATLHADAPAQPRGNTTLSPESSFVLVRFVRDQLPKTLQPRSTRSKNILATFYPAPIPSTLSRDPVCARFFHYHSHMRTQASSSSRSYCTTMRGRLGETSCCQWKKLRVNSVYHIVKPNTLSTERALRDASRTPGNDAPEAALYARDAKTQIVLAGGPLSSSILRPLVPHQTKQRSVTTLKYGDAYYSPIHRPLLHNALTDNRS
ncbi:hypothetical protein OG21DRAFT_1515804 [Imleria badia]|nr:hypothetical protein OG21DRAFT_1515804 [Imleria badia]